MHALTHSGLWLILLIVGLSGALSARANAEIPLIDAAPVAQFETATFSLG